MYYFLVFRRFGTLEERDNVVVKVVVIEVAVRDPPTTTA